MLLNIQDSEADNTMLKRKAIACIKAVASEYHQQIPDPVDPQRFRRKEQARDLGAFQDLPQRSSLVPVYEDHEKQDLTNIQNRIQLAEAYS